MAVLENVPVTGMDETKLPRMLDTPMASISWDTSIALPFAFRLQPIDTNTKKGTRRENIQDELVFFFLFFFKKTMTRTYMKHYN
jgi:hypothetical protein